MLDPCRSSSSSLVEVKCDTPHLLPRRLAALSTLHSFSTLHHRYKLPRRGSTHSSDSGSDIIYPRERERDHPPIGHIILCKKYQHRDFLLMRLQIYAHGFFVFGAHIYYLQTSYLMSWFCKRCNSLLIVKYEYALNFTIVLLSRYNQ